MPGYPVTPATTHTPRPSSPPGSGGGRTSLGALSGLLCVVFFVAAIIAGAATSPKGAPFATPYSDNTVARQALLTDPAGLHRSLQISGALQLLSALALLAFVPYLALFVERHGSRERAGVVRAAGTASGALLVLSACSGWVLSMIDPAALDAGAGLATARALQDTTFITGAGPAIGALGLALWLVARTVLTSRALPVWVGWSGLVIAVVSLLSLLSLITENATYAIPFSRYVGFVWFLAVSLLLWRREREA